MRNLFERFIEIWIVGTDGVPRQVLPYYMGQPIKWDAGDLVALTRDSPTQLTGTLQAGRTIQVVPASYSGTGPIAYQATLRLNGQVLAERTNLDPFDITLPTSGQLTWSAQAKGAHPTDPPPESLDWIVEAANVPVPEFTRPPSITPATGTVGSTFEIDPGEGSGLTWRLFLGLNEVTADVDQGEYTPNQAGQLRLVSTLSLLGQTRTAEATATVDPVVLPDWDVDGGELSIAFNRMPMPNPIIAIGGAETMAFEETQDA